MEVAPGLLVVPLLSWYNTAFDVQDPRCAVPPALPLAVVIGSLPAQPENLACQLNPAAEDGGRLLIESCPDTVARCCLVCVLQAGPLSA